jgi:hypothetical protein
MSAPICEDRCSTGPDHDLDLANAIVEVGGERVYITTTCLRCHARMRVAARIKAIWKEPPVEGESTLP